MEKIDELFTNKYKFFNSENLYWKNKIAYRVFFQFDLLENNKILLNKYRIYNLINISCYNLILDINYFLDNIDKYLEDKNDSLDLTNHNIYHCEITCNNCELLIRNNIIYDYCYNYEGFITIHSIYEGKCICVIDEKSSFDVINDLYLLKNCNKCKITSFNETYDSE